MPPSDADPCPPTVEFTQWATSCRGLFAFACRQRSTTLPSVRDLDAFDRDARPRANPHVSFAVTQNKWLRDALARWTAPYNHISPIGGGHAALSVHPGLLAAPLLNTLDQVVATGDHITVSPDDVFGWSRPADPSRPLTLRANLDITDHELTDLVNTIKNIATALWATKDSADVRPHMTTAG